MSVVADPKDERQIIRGFVRPSAKAAIEQVSLRYGMTQSEMLSRVYEWFAHQEEGVQAHVLDLLPRDQAPEIAELIAENLKAKRAKGFRRPRS